MASAATADVNGWTSRLTPAAAEHRSMAKRDPLDAAHARLVEAQHALERIDVQLAGFASEG